MSLELLGIVVIALGLATLFARPYWAFQIMALSTLFGAGMAINLPALGGAGILVPNLFLVFFMARMLLASGTGPFIASAIPPRPGFWLLVLTVLGVLSAYFLPRLFAGITDTMAVTRTYGGKSFITPSPLGPTGTNITQAVYAIGGLLAFAFAFAYARCFARPAQVIGAFLIVGLACAAVAALDLVTYYTGTGFILDSVRTANYNFLTSTEMSGMKRIAGTFAEASAFASYMLPLFAFSASLWLDKTRSMLAGPTAALLLLALVLSTSATALAGLAALIAMLTGRSLLSAMQRPGTMRTTSLGLAAMVCAVVLLALPVVAPVSAMEWWEYLQEALFSKATSSSGQERMLWNSTALQNFIDTSWAGAGLGSARASSYPLVLLSNVGIGGFVLFLLFVISLLGTRTGWASATTQEELEAAQAIRAGKAGFAATLISSALSATVYDLGLTVYLMAGTAAAFSAALKVRTKVARNASVATTMSGARAGV